jgi:hypothetical protein
MGLGNQNTLLSVSNYSYMQSSYTFIAMFMSQKHIFCLVYHAINHQGYRSNTGRSTVLQ